MEIFPGISLDPGIRFGKPCLAGTRMDVATVIGALGAGESYESVEQNYSLTREQILTATPGRRSSMSSRSDNAAPATTSCESGLPRKRWCFSRRTRSSTISLPISGPR